MTATAGETALAARTPATTLIETMPAHKLTVWRPRPELHRSPTSPTSRTGISISELSTTICPEGPSTRSVRSDAAPTRINCGSSTSARPCSCSCIPSTLRSSTVTIGTLSSKMIGLPASKALLGISARLSETIDSSMTRGSRTPFPRYETSSGTVPETSRVSPITKLNRRLGNCRLTVTTAITIVTAKAITETTTPTIVQSRAASTRQL